MGKIFTSSSRREGAARRWKVPACYLPSPPPPREDIPGDRILFGGSGIWQPPSFPTEDRCLSTKNITCSFWGICRGKPRTRPKVLHLAFPLPLPLVCDDPPLSIASRHNCIEWGFHASPDTVRRMQLLVAPGEWGTSSHGRIFTRVESHRVPFQGRGEGKPPAYSSILVSWCIRRRRLFHRRLYLQWDYEMPESSHCRSWQGG